MERVKDENRYPDYKTVMISGHQYYYTYYRNKNGKHTKVYAKTRRELYHKAAEKAQKAAEEREKTLNPTVADYCEKWLQMQSAYVRPETLRGYGQVLKKHVITPLGHLRMSEITADMLKMAFVPLSGYSTYTNETVNMLVKNVFRSYEANYNTDYNPAKKLRLKGGAPPRKAAALSDEQVQMLLAAVKGLPPELFVKIGLYAGLRREEILGLKWNSVFLEEKKPYIWVRRALRFEGNKPVVSEKLKTPASNRKIPIPNCLAESLRKEKERKQSEFVISDTEGNMLNDSKYQRMWNYIRVRTAGERKIYKYVNGQKTEKTVAMKVGDHCVNRPDLICTLDFHVTPMQLRYTYITNLIYRNVDPKTVQYLAGHKSSHMTMDVYARVKYNRPEELAPLIKSALLEKKGTKGSESSSQRTFSARIEALTDEFVVFASVN